MPCSPFPSFYAFDWLLHVCILHASRQSPVSLRQCQWNVCWDQRRNKHNNNNLLLPPLSCCCPSAEGYHSHCREWGLPLWSSNRTQLYSSAACAQSLGFVAWIRFHWQSTPGAARLLLRNGQSFSYPSVSQTKCRSLEGLCAWAPVWLQYRHIEKCSNWCISVRNLLFCS